MKYGLWENGKRNTWFNDEKVSLINQGAYDTSIHFTDENSVRGFQQSSTFSPPDGLSEGMNQVTRVLSLTFR